MEKKKLLFGTASPNMGPLANKANGGLSGGRLRQHIGRGVDISHTTFRAKVSSWASNSILFGVLVVEFSVESKNINRFAGERDDFFSKIQKGVPH